MSKAKGKKLKHGTGSASVRRDAQGRAHLVIQRDEYGTPVGVALEGPLFQEQWQNELALATAATTHQMLNDAYTPEQAAAVGENAMLGTSRMADGVIAQSPDRRPECRAGCAHCCHQTVGVTAPEVFAIHAHLRATRTPEELEAFAGHIRAVDDRTRGMATLDRVSPDFPCPFLVDQRCSIYEARPLACRGTNSLDASACERSLHDPATRAAFIAGTVSVPCYLEPLRAFHAVTAGLQLAIDQLHGLEATPLELTAAMRIMIDDPDTVPQQWLGGKDPFAAARGGDNTHDPRARKLSGLAE
jgi:Fe-S-cluster containining protein